MVGETIYRKGGVGLVAMGYNYDYHRSHCAARYRLCGKRNSKRSIKNEFYLRIEERSIKRISMSNEFRVSQKLVLKLLTFIYNFYKTFVTPLML